MALDGADEEEAAAAKAASAVGTDAAFGAAGDGDVAEVPEFERPVPPAAPQLPERPELEAPFASFSFVGLSASIQWLTSCVEALQRGLRDSAKERQEIDEKVKQRLDKLEKNVGKLLNAEPADVVQQEAPPPEAPPPLDIEEIAAELRRMSFVVEDDARCFASEAAEGVRQDLTDELAGCTKGLSDLAADVALRLQRDVFESHQGDVEAKLAALGAANEAGEGRHQKTEQAVATLGGRVDGLTEELGGLREQHGRRLDDCEASAVALDARTSTCESRLSAHDATLEAQEARLNGINIPPPLKEVAVPTGPDPALIQAQRLLEEELERLRNLVGVLRAQQAEDAARIADLIRKEEERAERERLAANQVEEESTGSEEERRRLEAERQRQALQADLDARMAQMSELANRGAKNLHHVVKGIERNTERLESKVEDMWGRLPKVMAMLEPLQAEAQRHDEEAADDRSENAYKDIVADSGSNKEEMQHLTRLMTLALQKSMDKLRADVEQTVSGLGEDLRQKAGAGELVALANRLDAWTQHAPGCAQRAGGGRRGRPAASAPSDRSESPPAAAPPPLSRGPSQRELIEATPSPSPASAASAVTRGRFRDGAAAAVNAEMAQLSASMSAPILEQRSMSSGRQVVGDFPPSNRSRGRAGHGPPPPPTCHDKCKQPTCPRSLEMAKSLGRLPKLHAQAV